MCLHETPTKDLSTVLVNKQKLSDLKLYFILADTIPLTTVYSLLQYIYYCSMLDLNRLLTYDLAFLR